MGDNYLVKNTPEWQTTVHVWSREDWNLRRKMVADIWERKDELEQKKLLAILVAHAPEAASTE